MNLPHRGPPARVVWTSGLKSGKDAAKDLAKETGRMAGRGYALESQLWAPEHKGRGILSTTIKAVVFLPLVVTGGGDKGKGRLTATFALREAPGS